MTLDSLRSAIEYLQTFTLDLPNLYGKSSLVRMGLVLEKLDNPQLDYPVVHIAGTSGKTSTAIIISHILKGQGFKTGLTYSPYVTTILEEARINNINIEESKFVKYLTQIVPVLESFRNTSNGYLTYLESLSILIAYIFSKEKVDVAIVETRVGGLYDMMNIFNPQGKICVITDLGLDHKGILGDSLAEIAYQKAGIIQPYNHVITIKQPLNARSVIARVARENLSPVNQIDAGKNYSGIKLVNGELHFNYKFKENSINDILLKVKGLFQVKNTALAISASIAFLDQNNKQLQIRYLKDSLVRVQLPARFNIFVHNGHQIILDGAHNNQKVQTFLKSLKTYYPNQKFVFLISLKADKDYKKILKQLVNFTDKVIFTEFTVENRFKIYAENSSDLVSFWNSISPNSHSEFIGPINKAKWQKVLDSLGLGERLVIFGSLYLAGQVYPWLNYLDKS